jgi:hypothetical protein
LASLIDDRSEITINAEQRSAIADGIIWGTLTIMKHTIERESPMLRAARDSKPFRQSKMAFTNNTISINILTNDQKLPARPRDFKSGLASEEKKIKNPELSDVLASVCRRLILKHSEKSFSSPRGRPISSFDPSNETRGRKSYYEVSRIKQIIEQVLNDHESFKKVDNAITGSDIYFKHKKYSIEVGLHQMKRYEKEFLNTYKPVFKKYGLNGTHPGGVYINKEDITDDWIEKNATRLARDAKSTAEEKRAIYTQGGVIYFDHIMQKHRTIT